MIHTILTAVAMYIVYGWFAEAKAEGFKAGVKSVTPEEKFCPHYMGKSPAKPVKTVTQVKPNQWVVK